MTGNGAVELAALRLGRELHADRYGGHRLPFAVLGAHGVRQRMTALEGPDAGVPFTAIDASGGYGSACLGAGHPAIVAGVTRGLTTAGYATDEVGSAERSHFLTTHFGAGGRFTDHFPTGEYHVAGRSSGSEGMELALRLVLEARVDQRSLRRHRDAAQRDLVVAFEGAWHGWTGGLLPLLNRRHYRAGLPEHTTEGPGGLTVAHLAFGDTAVVRDFFAEHGHRVLAVVVEPVQGDAGILLPERGYLRALARECDDHGALLVADEVLTFAKTGAFFAMADEDGPIPTDVTVIGKNIGMGAMPLSLVVARRGLTVRSSGAVATSDLRPLACAVATAGLDHIVEHDLLARARTNGAVLGELLTEHLVRRFPAVYTEQRGRGLMRGVELSEAASGAIDRLRVETLRAGAYTEFMAGAGRRSGHRRYVFPTMRIAPPLVAELADLTELVERIADGTRAFLHEVDRAAA